MGLACGPKTGAAFWPRKRPRRNATQSLCLGGGPKTRSKKWHPKSGHYLASKLAPPSTLCVGGWLSCVWGCRCMGLQGKIVCIPCPREGPQKPQKKSQKCGILRSRFGGQKMAPFLGPLYFIVNKRAHFGVHFLDPKMGPQNVVFSRFFYGFAAQYPNPRLRLVSHFGRTCFTGAICICAWALHSTPELKSVCPGMPVVATSLHHDVKHAGPKMGPRTKPCVAFRRGGFLGQKTAPKMGPRILKILKQGINLKHVAGCGPTASWLRLPRDHKACHPGC